MANKNVTERYWIDEYGNPRIEVTQRDDNGELLYTSNQAPEGTEYITYGHYQQRVRDQAAAIAESEQAAADLAAQQAAARQALIASASIKLSALGFTDGEVCLILGVGCDGVL